MILRGIGISLHSAGVAHIDAEDMGAAELCALLGVVEPPQWPPMHNDAATRAFFRDVLQQAPGNAEWSAWYVVAHEDGGDILAGTAGYVGPPQDGVVEIGYSILPQFQRRGFATEAVRLLISSAFARGAGVVAAQTLPDHAASQGVMTRNGMVFTGETEDDEHAVLWRFERKRPEPL